AVRAVATRPNAAVAIPPPQRVEAYPERLRRLPRRVVLRHDAILAHRQCLGDWIVAQPAGADEAAGDEERGDDDHRLVEAADREVVAAPRRRDAEHRHRYEPCDARDRI